MTTAELIQLAKRRERIAGYRSAAQALLDLADEEEREFRMGKDVATVQAEAEAEWEASLKQRRVQHA